MQRRIRADSLASFLSRLRFFVEADFAAEILCVNTPSAILLVEVPDRTLACFLRSWPQTFRRNRCNPGKCSNMRLAGRSPDLQPTFNSGVEVENEEEGASE